MKSRDILFALNDIDDTLITDALEAPAKKIAFRKLLPIAACFALLCVLLLALLLFAGKDHLPTPPGTTLPKVPLIEAGDRLADDATPSYRSESQGGMACYAYLTFDLATIVEAEVVEILPDSYINLDDGSYYNIARLRVIDSLNGKNLPEEIYLRYNSYGGIVHGFVRLSGYDSFLFSLDQTGIENYLMFNANTKEKALFPNMFEGAWSLSYGSAIAFTDGKVDLAFFDRALSYYDDHYVDEMAKMVFDDPEKYSYPVGRDSTIEEAKTRIATYLEKQTVKRPCDYLTADEVFSSEEASALRQYLAPNKGNLFTQKLSRYTGNTTITYTRVINGFSTNEVIEINVGTQRITETGERFTQEDLSALPDLAYAKNQITLDPENPPHVKLTFDPPGSASFKTFDYKLVYRKINGKVYGVIRAEWVFTYKNPNMESFSSTGDSNEPFEQDYRDDIYFLYDQNGNTWLHNRDSLKKTIGEDSIIRENRYFDPDNGIWW